MRHRLLLALSLVAVGGAAHAAAPTITFDVMAPTPTMTPGDYTTFELRYSAVGASLSNVVIAWDLPAGLIPVGAAAAGGFGVSCTPQDAPLNEDWQCTWTAAAITVPGGGVSGSLPVGVELLRWRFADGEQVSTQATFSASWSDGTSSGVITPVVGSETVTATGSADLSVTGYWDQSRPIGYGYVNGVPGSTSRVVVTLRNTGTVGVLSGSDVTVQLPADARLELFRADNGSVVTTTNAIGSTGPVSVHLARPVGATFVQSAPSAFISEEASAWFELRIWRPCTSEPALPTEGIDISWNGTVRGLASGSLLTARLAPHDNLLTPDPREQCQSAAQLSWSGSSSRIGPGQNGTFDLHAKPPSPVAEAYDVFFSAILPVGFALDRNPRINDEYADNVGLTPAGALYLCDIAGDTPPLTASEFALYRNTTACTDITAAQNGALARADVTHVVAVRDTWGEAAPGGHLLWADLGIKLSAYPDSCNGTTATFDGYLSWADQPGGAPTSLTASHTPVLVLESYPGWRPENNPLTAIRGSLQTIRVVPTGAPSYAPILNPVVRIPIPAGVAVQDVRYTAFAQNTCATVPPLLTSWHMDTATNPPTLFIPTGDGATPWYLNETSCVCAPAGPLGLAIDLYFDAAHPFVNGQQVSFVASIAGDNVVSTWIPQTYPVTLNMLVPPEMRLTVEPGCDTSPAAWPTFRVGFANSGGVPLADAVASFDVPAGTQLVDAVTTLGSVECFDGATWSAACSSTTTRVRVAFASLAPYHGGTLTIRLDPLGAAPGTAIYAEADLTSTTLDPLHSAPRNPAVVGTCPGELDLQVWWDDLNPGVLDAGELAAPGWWATVTNTVTGDVLSVPLGNAGLAATLLAPGTYTVVFVAPGDAQATWSVNPSPGIGPYTVVIVANQTAYIGIGVSCACGDGDSCTLDSCSPAGVCTFAIPPEGCCGNGVVNADEQCDDGNNNPFDGCSGCYCSFIGYTFDGEACVPRCGDGLVIAPEACDDGNAVDGDGCSATCTLEPGADCGPLAIDQCVPSAICDGPLPSWVDVNNPAHAWVLIMRGNGDGTSPCDLSPFDCANLSTTACTGVDCTYAQLCDFCDAMAITVCQGCSAETCDGEDDDCDGVIDNGCDDDGDELCDGTMVYDPAPGAVVVACPDGPGDCDDEDPLTPLMCPVEGGGRIFGEVQTAAGPRSFRCTFVAGGAPECEVERDGDGQPVLVNGQPVLALYPDLVCE